MLYSLFFFFFFLLLLLVPGCFSLKIRAKCKVAALGKKWEKKRERRDFTLLFSVSGFRFVFARTRTQRYARRRQKEREREKEGSRTPVVVFCGLVRETRAFCLRKGNSKEREREREREIEFLNSGKKKKKKK